MSLRFLKAGSFGVRDKFTSSQAQIINEDLPKGIDGVGGGIYTPSTAIFIGGEGLHMTGPFQCDVGVTIIGNMGVDGNAQFTGAVAVGNTLAITGATTVSGLFTVNVNAGIFNQGLLVNGPASAFTSTVEFSAATTFEALSTFTAGATFSGSNTVNFNNATTQIGGALNISAVVRLISAAHIRKRIDTSTGTTRTVSVSDADYFQPGSLSANSNWTISDGADGDEIIFSLAGSIGDQSATAGFLLRLLKSDTTEITTMRYQTPTYPNYVHIIWRSGAWHIFAQSLYAVS